MAVCSSDVSTCVDIIKQAGRAVSFASFKESTDDLLDKFAPAAIISPVLTEDFDCIDLALLLHRHNFKEKYVAVSGNLPNPLLVAAEIKQACPSLDFEVVGLF